MHYDSDFIMFGCVFSALFCAVIAAATPNFTLGTHEVSTYPPAELIDDKLW